MSIPTIEVVPPGSPLTLGANPGPDGTNFALFSRHAWSVTLCLFDEPGDRSPAIELRLDPSRHRTGDVWHVLLPDLSPGRLYLYRIDGPFAPREGHRYGSELFVLDPYARAHTAIPASTRHAVGYDPDRGPDTPPVAGRSNVDYLPKCVVVDNSFNWRGDRFPRHPLGRSVIYEAHVRGLTKHASADLEHPGTYTGVIERIPYLQSLGITAVELLPIFEFDENEFQRHNPNTGEALRNYWGYNPISFFAPKAGYAAGADVLAPVREFKEMVRALHEAGIEVILDVVFNHTAEGNEAGPTLSFRGIDNTIYYMLDEDRRRYRNFSGVGNTLNCNHPVVQRLILDALRYWVVEMHVDGFRFDLGSILARGQDGTLLKRAPIVEAISEDPVLSHVKLISEAWDAGGAYQVGAFHPVRWAEWNDRFRDGVRRFWRGDAGTVADFATRLSGSSDLYDAGGRKPAHSINYVTAHDGFTAWDLVSYNRKHNEENGEENRDGHEPNFSFNHGIEGFSSVPAINALRTRQVKNLLGTTLLSLGTPMLLSGDEFARTQRGNNNAYCQDNEISWLNYERLAEHEGLHRFVRELIRFRSRHPALTRPDFFTGTDKSRNDQPDISWHNEHGGSMDWNSSHNLLALLIDGDQSETQAERDDNDFFFMFNASDKDHLFMLVDPPSGGRWHRAVDTYRKGPEDIRPVDAEAPLQDARRYRVHSHSLVVLVSRMC